MENSLSIGNALRAGWEAVTDRPVFMVSLAVFPIATWVIGNLLAFFLFAIGQPVAAIVAFLVFLIQLYLNFLVRVGTVQVSVDTVRGKTPRFSELFAYGQKIVPFLIASALFSLAVVAGLILFILPGIYIALRGSMFAFALVDGGLRPTESIRRSFELTRGHVGGILLFIVMIAGLNVLGLLFLGLGILFTIPMSLVALAHVYEQLSQVPVSPSAVAAH